MDLSCEESNMTISKCCRAHFLLAATIFLGSGGVSADEPINLFADGLQTFKTPVGDWQEVASVEMDQANPRLLQAKPGKGIWYNGPKGRARDLYTKEKFG